LKSHKRPGLPRYNYKYNSKSRRGFLKFQKAPQRPTVSGRRDNSEGDFVSRQPGLVLLPGTESSWRLLTGLARKKGILLVERGRLQTVISEVRLQQSGGFDQNSALNLGNLLGTGEIITGSLHRTKNGDVEITARLINIETASVLAAASRNLRSGTE